MIVPYAWPQVLDFFGTPLVIEPWPGQRPRDAGLLSPRRFDERVGLTRAFASGARRSPRRRQYESAILQGFGLDKLATKWQQHWPCQPSVATMSLAEER